MSASPTTRRAPEAESSYTPWTEVAAPQYIIVGRSRDCDLILGDPSVSGRHARLSWRNGQITIEDLGSANGTWVRGEKVETAAIRPGDDVRLGSESLPWSDPRLKPFLRAGARGDTVVGMSIPGHRFICGACGTRGTLPTGFKKGILRCKSCGASLYVGKRHRGMGLGVVAVVSLIALAGGAAWAMAIGGSPDAFSTAAERLGLRDDGAPTRSRQEESVRVHTAPKVVAAMDYEASLTRNTAVRVAADEQGPFHVEQVARIWTHVRGRWRYVNDPRGGEYFATASETITNDYAGDCDDFAIVLASMITAIGGDARVVMMDGPAGGHAYAEACIHQDPRDAARRLSQHYRRNWDQYLGRQRLDQIHFRSSDDCQVWLNLDWNAGVPGGNYGGESWAVAIYPGGRTETLSPAQGAPGATEPPDVAGGGEASGAALAPQ
jgi:hypothetical protein